jgi:hypothetical protein
MHTVCDALRASVSLGADEDRSCDPRNQSRKTTLRRELIFKSPLSSMNPTFRNLFMKKFTRERVVKKPSASYVVGPVRRSGQQGFQGHDPLTLRFGIPGIPGNVVRVTYRI